MNLVEISSWLDLAVFLAVILFIAFLWYYVLYFILAFRKTPKLPRSEKYSKFAVLIPARNESKVISNILKSFQNMDYPKDYFDVYVIVENVLDPTIDIVKSFGFQYIVRGDLTNRKTKGYALDDAYQYLKKNNLKYDAYVIFDADNVVDSEFLLYMNDCRQAGYQVACGYRSFTNATKNWITSTSALLFSFMNQFTSKGRSVLFEKATVTGTGYFIDANIVDDCGGWIWNGMTEDVEVTAYCYYHNIRMHYYPYAKYYDEQPQKYRDMHHQHVRWVWGFMASKKKFKKVGKTYPLIKSKTNKFFSMIEYNGSIIPFVVLCSILTCSTIATFVMGFVALAFDQVNASYIFIHALTQFAMIYSIFMICAIFTLIIDNRNLKFNFGRCLIVVFTYMFFFGDFLLAFLDGLVHRRKRSSWRSIGHSGNIVDKQALESTNGEKQEN